MAEFVISSYFEDNTGPVTGLTPTIRIWEVTSAGDELIVGAPCGTGLATDGTMVEVEDCGSPATTQDGFYRFVFADTIGYSPTTTYVVKIDGGGSLQTRYRYQTGEIIPSVLDAARTDHLISGSIGEAISQTKADTSDIIDKLYLDADSVLEVVQLLLKMEAGRTRIDPTQNTLTVFDEDCTTVLRVFKLYDSAGNESVVDVCERKPVVKGVSDGTTITDVCSYPP
jgi:hypothetical protein